MHPTFPHRLLKPNSFGIVDVSAIAGYLAALSDVLNLILEKTESKPCNRFIDACEIIDRIANTSAELTPVIQSEQDRLRQQESIILNQLTNPDHVSRKNESSSWN